MKKYKNILVGLVFVFGLYFYFINLAKSIPYSYYDEFWMISDSYLSEYYFKGNWHSNVWDSFDAKHQPMVTRLVISAAICPYYFKAKMLLPKQERKSFSYSKFLISSGFAYSKTNNKINIEFLETNDYKKWIVDANAVGSKQDFVSKYGEWVKLPISFIDAFRHLNALILSLTLVFIYYYFKSTRGHLFSLILTILLVTNKILVESSLKAHSEALLFLLSVFSLYFIIEFLEKFSFKSLFKVSSSIALTASTKINGIFLYPALIVLIALLKTKKSPKLLKLKYILLSGLLIFAIFSLLNPHILMDPWKNTLDMYALRYKFAVSQSNYWSEEALSNIPERLWAIYDNSFKTQNIPQIVNVFLFLMGLIKEIRKVYLGDNLASTFLFSFLVLLIAMLNYLLINWVRYYIPLVFFIIYYQTIGLDWIFKQFKHN